MGWKRIAQFSQIPSYRLIVKVMRSAILNLRSISRDSSKVSMWKNGSNSSICSEV